LKVEAYCSTAMGESRKQKDLWGSDYVEHSNDDGKVIAESRPETTWLGNDYIETRHADGTVSRTYKETGLLGGEYLETIDADGGKSITREQQGLFGDKYLETTHPDGSVTRSDERTDFWGRPYMEHTDGRGRVPVGPRAVVPVHYDRPRSFSSGDGAPLVELPMQMGWFMMKVGLVLFALVVAIMIVFTSLPFWAGGLALGWVSGFAMGVWRGFRAGPVILGGAPVARTAKGGYKVDERVTERLRKTSPDLVVPGLLALAWMILLIWPLHVLHDEMPWVIGAALAAGAVGVFFAVMRAKAGFRRGLHWSVRTTQALPGGWDAAWGTVGTLFCAMLLFLLAIVGRGLPDSLRRDFLTPPAQPSAPIPSKSSHDQNRNRSTQSTQPNPPRGGASPPF
jgi:hypothetical protein